MKTTKDGRIKQSGGKRQGAGNRKKDPAIKKVQIFVSCPRWMQDEMKERLKVIMPREIEAIMKKYNKI